VRTSIWKKPRTGYFPTPDGPAFECPAGPGKGHDQDLRLWAEMTMVKETKIFRQQAEKAERMARATSNEEASESLSNLAEAYRNQADALKRSKKPKKKSCKKTKPKAKK
jgi:hypothetical protein